MRRVLVWVNLIGGMLAFLLAISILIVELDHGQAVKYCREFQESTGIPTRFMEPHWRGDYWCDVMGTDGQWHKTYLN